MDTALESESGAETNGVSQTHQNEDQKPQDADKRVRELEREVERQKSTVASLTLELEKLKSQLAARSEIEGLDDAFKIIEQQKEEIDLLKEQLLNARATPASPRLRSLTGSRPSSIARPPTRTHLRNKPGSLTETTPPPESRASVDDDDVPLAGPTRATGISSSVRRQRAATSAPSVSRNAFGGGLASIIAQQAVERSPGSRRVRVSPMVPKAEPTPAAEATEPVKEERAPSPSTLRPVSPPVRQAEVTVTKEPETPAQTIPTIASLRKVEKPAPKEEEKPQSVATGPTRANTEESAGISKFGLKRVSRAPPPEPTPEPKESVPAFMTQLRRTNPPRSTQPPPAEEKTSSPAPIFGQLKKVTKPEPAKEASGGGGAGKLYSLDELKKYPAGVDRKQMELHLQPEDFQSAFGASKEEFSSWAPWKKERAKKKIGLW